MHTLIMILMRAGLDILGFFTCPLAKLTLPRELMLSPDVWILTTYVVDRDIPASLSVRN